MTSQRLLWSSVVAVGVVVTLSAQAPRPTFEVASIKRNLSGEPGSNANTAMLMPMPGGRFQAQNSTLFDIVRYVYGVSRIGTSLDPHELTGGPEWMRTDRFDIDAKADRDVSRDQVLLMMQSLLEERFRLVVQTVPREGDVYVLTIARSDGRLGTDLRKAPDDCKTNRPADPAAIIARTPRPSSGARLSSGGMCATIASLTRSFSRTLQTPVIDKTGLTGLWDYALAHSGVQPTTGADGKVDERLPFFTAVQDQLGLKLDRTRGPVDVLVIDSVQQPTEN